jgi:hypothetical protein
MLVATTTRQARPGHGAHGFLRHLFEMALAMMAGMMVSAAIFLSAVGMTAAEAMREHAVLFVVLQAFGMTVAMATWMRHRRHTWRSSSEMAAAMVIPAVPLICLRLLDVISGPICGVYCFTTIVAMVVVMLYRRADYAVAASASRPSRLVGRPEGLASFARSKGTTAGSVTKRQAARAAPAIHGTSRPQARRSARAAAGLRRGANDRGLRQ